MLTLYHLLLAPHVAFGFFGLAAFWVPIFMPKGGTAHIRAGRVFLWSAYIVGGTAFALAVLTLISPFGTHPEARPADPAGLPEALAELRALEAFLAYLAVITIATVHHGVRVMQEKGDPAGIRSPFHTGINVLSILAGAGSLALGLTLDHGARWIFVALSPIGFLVGIGALRYARRPKPSRMAHWYEHLGAMIGGGIAFHTAFLVFGIQRFVDYSLEGLLGIIPWVAPSVIGGIGIALFQRHYRRRFEAPPARPSTA